jgi:hypothetical protein
MTSSQVRGTKPAVKKKTKTNVVPGNFGVLVNTRARIPKVGREVGSFREFSRIAEAVECTVENLPWRTSEDDAVVKLATTLARNLDDLVADSKKIHRATDLRFINNNIRELAELLLKTLVELGATPMARKNLMVQGQEEEGSNPIENFRNTHSRS